MARTRKQRKSAAADNDPDADPVASIPHAQPDRSGPSDKTLLDMARERDLFQQADDRAAALEADNKTKGKDAKGRATLTPGEERIMESVLWTATMAILHFTFDYLVHYQYGVEVSVPQLVFRAMKAWLAFGMWFYPLHPHEANPSPLLPGIPPQHRHAFQQTIFFTMSAVAGSYLTKLTTVSDYLANMKRAPPIVVFWIWAVAEMDLPVAVASLFVPAGWAWWHGYASSILEAFQKG
jgi:hypothetical protein